MQGKFGATNKTPGRLLLDAGVIYKDFDLEEIDGDPFGGADKENLGATRGGVTWSLGREYRNMEFDGELGPTKNMVRRENIEPTIEADLLEFTKDRLEEIIGGATTEDIGTNGHEVIKGGEFSLNNGEYIDNITYVGKISGVDDPIIVQIENVLVMPDWDVDTDHEDEAVIPVTFAAHFELPEEAGGEMEEPWAIYMKEETE